MRDACFARFTHQELSSAGIGGLSVFGADNVSGPTECGFVERNAVVFRLGSRRTPTASMWLSRSSGTFVIDSRRLNQQDRGALLVKRFTKVLFLA